MEFTIGNIITLLIVVIILAIYRQMDKNNRSLEKIKRYSEKIKDELDIYIDSKTIEVKNFAIELDVHQETGKAILNRIVKAEENLDTRADHIDKMYERINEYDKALDELTQMTGRVQENLNRLHDESEFVDKVGKRVKDAGLGILSLEKNISGLKHEFAKENIKELKIVRSVVLKDTQKVVAQIKNDINTSEARINNFTAMVKELEATKDIMKKDTVDSIQSFLDDQIYRTEQSAEQLTAELVDRFETILSGKSGQVESIESGMQTVLDNISEKFTSISNNSKQDLLQFKDQVKVVEGSFSDSLQAAAERGKFLEDEVFAAVKQKIDSDIIKVTEGYNKNLNEISRLVSDKLSNFNNTYTEITDNNKKELEEISMELTASDKSIRNRIEGVESRVNEYEDSINYKFAKLEDISGDLDSLEKNLRISMDQSVAAIEAEFMSYSKQQDQVQKDYKQKLSDEMKELDEGLNALEIELNGLKNRAYENVAKGLKVFEDDFFSDLKNKNVVMEEKIIEWQGGIDKTLEDLALSGENNRIEVEKNYSEALQLKLAELQERIFSNQLKFENQVTDFQSRIEGRMSHTDTSVESIEEAIKKNLIDIKESTKATFSREFVEFNTGVNTQLKKSERDINSKLKKIEELVEQKAKEVIGFAENSRSEVTIWQAKILQDMKEAESEMTTGYEDIKKEVFNNITQIKSDFESQKEDLIINTQEERSRIKNELKENAAGIIQLESDLRSKTDNSLENFNREYDAF
ncbi:MAG: hypothetical protein J7L71_07835, partial [Spirochaetaceae bacterium]|nr:hypothetical protein [Spirochaetaceae bacterium]